MFVIDTFLQQLSDTNLPETAVVQLDVSERYNSQNILVKHDFLTFQRLPFVSNSTPKGPTNLPSKCYAIITRNSSFSPLPEYLFAVKKSGDNALPLLKTFHYVFIHFNCSEVSEIVSYINILVAIPTLVSLIY